MAKVMLLEPPVEIIISSGLIGKPVKVKVCF
jgi:hypothetical protein